MSKPLPENVGKVEAAIKFKPMTIPLICLVTDVSQPTIKRVIDDLREKGMCHIVDYEIRDKSNARAAVYTFGPGVDVPRPPRIQKPELNRRFKAKLREDKYRAAEARRRERIRIETEKPAFRHPMDVALFGPAPVASISTPIPRRVFQQSMKVTADELEEV